MWVLKPYLLQPDPIQKMLRQKTFSSEYSGNEATLGQSQTSRKTQIVKKDEADLTTLHFRNQLLLFDQGELQEWPLIV